MTCLMTEMLMSLKKELHNSILYSSSFHPQRFSEFTSGAQGLLQSECKAPDHLYKVLRIPFRAIAYFLSAAANTRL